MEPSELADKQWASKYLLDPLTAPEPSQETGPGSHFYTTKTDSRTASTTKTPVTTTSAPHSRSSSGSKAPTSTAYPSPPSSASPTQSSFHPSNPYSPTHRQTAFGAYPNTGPSRHSTSEPLANNQGRRSRGSSLGERYPGDMSHRPLDQLRREAKAADRAPHLKKRHLPGADQIDVLDRSFGGAYHHDGPYDATLLARNTSLQSSPVEAVRGTNEEALRATPRENITDSLRRHVPLHGTAIIPPGMAGMDGRTMRYEEGADLMREEDAPGGAYRRWGDRKYLPEDYKGKGEPSFSIERALKQHDQANKNNPHNHRRILSDGDSAYEMQPHPQCSTIGTAGPASRQRSASGSHADLGSGNGSGNAGGKGALASVLREHDQGEGSVRRSHTTGRRVGEGLKRRLGSLRRGKGKGGDV